MEGNYKYCGIFAQSKNCGATAAGGYYAAALKNNRGMVFSAKSVPMATNATTE
jgi:hypothetical protein